MQNAERIRAYLTQHRADILEDLLTLVRAQSPTSDKAAVDRCGEVLIRLCGERLGLTPTVYPQEKYGNHLSFRYGSGEKLAFYCGHFDTIWNIDALPLIIEEDIIKGPGVCDMKFGDISAIWALKALKDLEIPLAGSVELFFNADEEVGSPSSRSFITDAACGARAAIMGEPASGKKGVLKIARKGGGEFRIKVTGRASHAGSDHAGGRSAIEEAARIVLAVHALTDYDKGTTTNVGVITGGTKRNVVAAECNLAIDFRVKTAAEAERLTAAMHALTPHRDGITIEVEGGLHRPPFEDTPANRALFALAQKCAAELGMPALEGEAVGGMGDGNLTGAAGVPTIDGMGAVGGGAHALTEHILVQPSLDRIPLMALLLTKL